MRKTDFEARIRQTGATIEDLGVYLGKNVAIPHAIGIYRTGRGWVVYENPEHGRPLATRFRNESEAYEYLWSILVIRRRFLQEEVFDI